MEKHRVKKRKFPVRLSPTLDRLLRTAALITHQSQVSIIEDALALGMGVGSNEAEVRMSAVKAAVGNHGTQEASRAAIKQEEDED